MPTKEDSTNQATNQQQVSITAKSQFVNVELHSSVELHLEDELQNEENAHSNSKANTYGRDIETPDRDVHSDNEAERECSHND